MILELSIHQAKLTLNRVQPMGLNWLEKIIKLSKPAIRELSKTFIRAISQNQQNLLLLIPLHFHTQFRQLRTGLGKGKHQVRHQRIWDSATFEAPMLTARM